jgi:ribose transport system substrate-binding protein
MTKEAFATVLSSFSQGVPKNALIAVCVLYALTTTIVCAESVVFGFVGIEGESEFKAVRAGAEDEAKELSHAATSEVRLDWRDVSWNPEAQFNAVSNMVAEHDNAIAVPAEFDHPELIKVAFVNGVPVVVYGGDEPVSQALATVGTDNFKCGKALMAAMAKIINEKGLVALFGGYQNNPFLQRRVNGARTQAQTYPAIQIFGPRYSDSTPESISKLMQDVLLSEPYLSGWVSVVYWGQFNSQFAPLEPGKIPVAAADPDVDSALEAVKRKYIQILLVQNFYEWGRESVKILYDKVVSRKNPESPFVPTEVTTVTIDTVNSFLDKWRKWTRR